MKNKIKKFLSLCILVPTLVLSPIQTQAFAISGMITLGMFVNFLVSTVIVTGVVYEFTNGTPVIGYTDYKDILTKNDTSKYKFDNTSLLSVKSATDLVTLGLTPLEADNIVEAYDEYCEYYETVPETEPYTFKKSSVFTSTVSLAKSLNYVVPSYEYTSLTPSVIINESNYFNYGLEIDEYNAITEWSEVYYYLFVGAYSSGNSSRTKQETYHKFANGEIDFYPCVIYSNGPIVFKDGKYLSTSSTVQAYVIGYNSNGTMRKTYDDDLSTGTVMPYNIIDTTSATSYSIVFNPPSSNTFTLGPALIATNDETYSYAYSIIEPDIINKNLIAFGNADLPVVNNVVGAESSVIDVVLPYRKVDTVTVLPGSIALSPSSVDEYKNSIVADESFSLTLPAEDVIAPPVDGTQDLSGILEFLQRILDGILAIPRAITQTITDFFSAQPTTTIDFSPLFISLADKFPFCLPFDLFNAFKSFVATPVVPKFEITFDKGLVGAGSFTFDFAPFTKLAAILRYFILLVFVTSLINKTKNMIN